MVKMPLSRIEGLFKTTCKLAQHVAPIPIVQDAISKKFKSIDISLRVQPSPFEKSMLANEIFASQAFQRKWANCPGRRRSQMCLARPLKAGGPPVIFGGVFLVKL